MQVVESKYELYDFAKVKTEVFYNFYESILVFKDATIKQLNELEDKQEYKKCLDVSTNFLTETAKNLFYIVTKELNRNIVFTLQDSSSYCALKENKIQISLQILQQKNIRFENKINIITGIIFHEFFHKRFTIAEFKNFDFLKDNLFLIIFNILEDFRIEYKGIRDFKNLFTYFKELRKYSVFINDNILIDLVNDEYIVLNFLIKQVLMPEIYSFKQYHSLYKEFKSSNILFVSKEENKDLKYVLTELDKLNIEISNYRNNPTIEKLLELTNIIYEIIVSKYEAKSFEDIDYKEIFNEKSGYSEEEIPLSDSEVSSLNKQVQEVNKVLSNYEKFLDEQDMDYKTIKLPSENFGTKTIKVEKLLNTTQDNYIVKKARPLIEKLKLLDKYIQTAIEDSSRTHDDLNGLIDEELLHSIKYNNKIFYNIDDEKQIDICFFLLLDISGSMRKRISELKLISYTFIQAFKNSKYVKLYIYAHTADNKGINSVNIYHCYSPNYKSQPDSIFRLQALSSNADGFAIEYCGSLIKNIESNFKNLIVISDGLPSANGYGGEEAEEHVRNVVNELNKKKVTTIQICIDNFEGSSRMFKNIVNYSEDLNIYIELKKILMRELGKIKSNS